MNREPTVGICEDDDGLRGLLGAALRREGYGVRATSLGAEAVAIFTSHPPDVLILDIGLPDSDGRDVLHALRAQAVDSPVVFVTARDALTDRLSGFRAGADDYLVKPFALSELVARVDALLRRAHRPPSAGARPSVILDPASHGIVGAAGVVALTPTEFRVLGALLAQTGTVVRRDVLVRAGWVDGARVSPNTLDAYVSRLRGKLRQARVPMTIDNARGIGYRLS